MTEHTYYIATDFERTAIYGLGATEQNALEDATQWLDPDGNHGLVTYPCSSDLAIEVLDAGGNIAWNLEDGIATLDTEAS